MIWSGVCWLQTFLLNIKKRLTVIHFNVCKILQNNEKLDLRSHAHHNIEHGARDITAIVQTIRERQEEQMDLDA